MNTKVYNDIVVFFYIVLFMYTGLSKILAIHTFERSLLKAPLLSGVATPISIIVPILEMIIGGCLVFSFLLSLSALRRYGLYSGFALLLIFTIYLAGVLSFSKHRPCGCGGIISKMTWSQHIIFNAIFIIAGAIAIYYERPSKKATGRPVAYKMPHPSST